MTSIVLVPWGKTDWTEAGRLGARTPMPLNDNGNREAVHWAKDIAGREVAAVYSGDDPTSLQTARLLARTAEVKLKQLPGLGEIDLGLWEGLTPEQVEARFPKLFKRWVDEPASVCPPQGEPVGEACDRIVEAVRKIARKYKGSAVAVVLGPVAMAAARSHLENGKSSTLQHMKTTEPVWYRLPDKKNAPPVPA